MYTLILWHIPSHIRTGAGKTTPRIQTVFQFKVFLQHQRIHHLSQSDDLLQFVCNRSRSSVFCVFIWSYFSFSENEFLFVKRQQNDLMMNREGSIKIVKCMLSFIGGLFVCGFPSHSKIFHSYRDVTISDEGLQILTHARTRGH